MGIVREAGEAPVFDVGKYALRGIVIGVWWRDVLAVHGLDAVDLRAARVTRHGRTLRDDPRI